VDVCQRQLPHPVQDSLQLFVKLGGQPTMEPV